MFSEEGGERVEWDEVEPVVQIHMARSRNDVKLLGFGCQPVGIFAVIFRMRLFSGDEQDRAAGNRADVLKWAELEA